MGLFAEAFIAFFRTLRYPLPNGPWKKKVPLDNGYRIAENESRTRMYRSDYIFEFI